ncbi:MAG: GTP 3',8-cyclase MoaA [Opitutales bacterium]|nr:GTP 3',8-cyclase MoaA [Opitutales bacterium]
MTKPVIDKLGRPIRDLRISLTDQCNFRCSYCMPKEVFGPEYAFLPKRELLDNKEVLLLVHCFTRLGVEKVRLTGGEPLLRRDLVDLVHAISTVKGVRDLSLTTNGSLLPRYAQDLKDAGLNRINVSLDSLDKDIFQKMAGGRGDPKSVIAGIDASLEAGLSIKTNMVVRKGVNVSEILPMVSYFRDRRITLRFIEYMDVGNTNQWKLNEVYPSNKILDIIRERYQFAPVDPNYRGEVATRYRYTDIPVEFGLINSITKPFCSDCNRARLSADGKLYSCLFASNGHDLKNLVRSRIDKAEIVNAISKIWINRHDRYSEERATGTQDSNKIEMSYIGG